MAPAATSAVSRRGFGGRARLSSGGHHAPPAVVDPWEAAMAAVACAGPSQCRWISAVTKHTISCNTERIQDIALARVIIASTHFQIVYRTFFSRKYWFTYSGSIKLFLSCFFFIKPKNTDDDQIVKWGLKSCSPARERPRVGQRVVSH